MHHVELHVFKRTPEELRLAELAGIIEDGELITCQICASDLVFVYALVSEDKSIISCEYCIKVAIPRVMM
jgi:hypothetical protein